MWFLSQYHFNSIAPMSWYTSVVVTQTSNQRVRCTFDWYSLGKLKGKLNSSPTPQVNNERVMYFVLCASSSHLAVGRGSLCSFSFFPLLWMGVTTFFSELQDRFRVIWSLQLWCNPILIDSKHKWCYWSHNVFCALHGISQYCSLVSFSTADSKCLCCSCGLTTKSYFNTRLLSHTATTQ